MARRVSNQEDDSSRVLPRKTVCLLDTIGDIFWRVSMSASSIGSVGINSAQKKLSNSPTDVTHIKWGTIIDVSVDNNGETQIQIGISATHLHHDFPRACFTEKSMLHMESVASKTKARSTLSAACTAVHTLNFLLFSSFIDRVGYLLSRRLKQPELRRFFQCRFLDIISNAAEFLVASRGTEMFFRRFNCRFRFLQSLLSYLKKPFTFGLRVGEFLLTFFILPLVGVKWRIVIIRHDSRIQCIILGVVVENIKRKSFAHDARSVAPKSLYLFQDLKNLIVLR